jgi:hypothetical protein
MYFEVFLSNRHSDSSMNSQSQRQSMNDFFFASRFYDDFVRIPRSTNLHRNLLPPLAVLKVLRGCRQLLQEFGCITTMPKSLYGNQVAIAQISLKPHRSAQNSSTSSKIF